MEGAKHLCAPPDHYPFLFLAALSSKGLSWGTHALFVHLYLPDMSLFAVANSAYCRYMPEINPPSRACVQVPLPKGVVVRIHVLAMTQDQDLECHETSNSSLNLLWQTCPRNVLHVRSISDWAPSCIGPYSQVTGQVGHRRGAGAICFPWVNNCFTTCQERMAPCRVLSVAIMSEEL